MRLVFIIDNPNIIGGGDYAQFKFAEHLAKFGHKVTVFAANYNSFFEDFEDIPNLNIKVRHEIPLFIRGIGVANAIWDKVYTTMFVETFVKKTKPDYLLIHIERI